MKKKIAVIGSGASGISVAYHLLQEGVDVHIFEKESEIGGRMSTEDLNGKEVCLGGKNIGKKYPLFREFCKHYGEDDFEEFGLNTSNGQGKKTNTFNSDKRLKSVIELLKGIPLKDIIRLIPMIVAVGRNRNNAYFSGTYFRKFVNKKRKTLTLDSYFSEELQERIIRRITVRTNGAEPSEVPVANFGTNIAMIMDNYEQLRDGPKRLFEKFKKSVHVHLNTEVKELIFENETVKGIITREEKIDFDYVILATPAYITANILSNTHKDLSEKLKSIRYNPVGILVTEYEQDVFSMDKRAWTFPEKSVLSNAGSYGVNDRNIVRYTFSGITSRSLLDKNISVEELVKIAEQEVETYTDLTLGKRVGNVGKIMTHGLCSYSYNHQLLLDDINKIVESKEGMTLAGDYMEGLSIEGCFLSGLKASKNVKIQMNKIG